jgi:hypothetical protein
MLLTFRGRPRMLEACLRMTKDASSTRGDACMIPRDAIRLFGCASNVPINAKSIHPCTRSMPPGARRILLGSTGNLLGFLACFWHPRNANSIFNRFPSSSRRDLWNQSCHTLEYKLIFPMFLLIVRS